MFSRPLNKLMYFNIYEAIFLTGFYVLILIIKLLIKRIPRSSATGLNMKE